MFPPGLFEHIDPFEATTTPTDINGGTDEGHYLCQSQSAVLWARRTTAPADPGGYFYAAGGSFFRFDSGPEAIPTWVRILPGQARTSTPVARELEGA